VRKAGNENREPEEKKCEEGGPEALAGEDAHAGSEPRSEESRRHAEFPPMIGKV
jgi:hypothetical protein